MKKLIVVLSLALMLPAVGMAQYKVWRSSRTVAAKTTLNVLCGAGERGIFHGVCTDFGVAASSVAVVNSTWTYTAATTLAGPITTLVADQCKYYDITLPGGLSFFKNNAAGITILYDCY